MTEITVVNNEQIELSKEQRSIYYKTAALKLNISYDVLENLGDLMDQTKIEALNNEIPDIYILLIRKLINKGIIPVIEKNNKKDELLQLNNFQLVMHLDDYEIFVKSNTIKFSIIKPGESIIIKHLLIPEYILPINLESSKYIQMSLIDKLKTGNYDNQYLWLYLFYPILSIDNKLMNQFGSNINNYYLIDNTKLKSVLMSLNYLDKYFMQDYIYNYIYNALNYPIKSSDNFINKFIEFGNTDVTQPEIQDVEHKFKLSKKLESILDLYNIKLGRYENSLWFSFHNKGILYLLTKLLINEKDSEIDYIINKYKNKNKAIAELQLDKQNKLKNQLKELKYRKIYIKKFGYTKFIKLNPNNSILNEISENEKAQILLEYNRPEIENQWAKIVNKISLCYNFNQKMKLWEEFEKQLPKEYSDTNWILDKNGNPIICPHLKTLLDMQKNNSKTTDIRNAMLKYARDIIDNKFYCGICGEALISSEDEDKISFEGIKVLHSLEDELMDFIWKQTIMIVKNYINFKTFHTDKYINDFVWSISRRLYEIIYDMEKKLIKVKTNTMEEIENKKRLYTNIYIYALLIKLVINNPNILNFKTNYDPFKFATEKLIYMNNTSADDEFIKTNLQKAYTNISALIDLSLTPEEFKINQDLNPVIKYIEYFYYLSFMPDSNAKKLTSNIVKSIETTNNYKFTRFKELKSGEFKLGSVKNLDDLNKYHWNYAVESFKYFMKYLDSDIYLESLFDVKIVNDIIDSELNINLKKFYNEMSGFLETELMFFNLKKFFNAKINNKPSFIKSRKFKLLTKDFIGLIYGDEINPKPDEQLKKYEAKSGFHKHKWLIHMYEYDNKIIYLDKDFLDKWNYKYIDSVCKICLYSKTQMMEKDVSLIIDQHQNLVAFYNYYQYRCPLNIKGVIHEFTDDICNLCHYDKRMYMSMDKSYYNKYKSYLTIKQESFMAKKTEWKEPIIPKDIENWHFNSNITIELANLVDTNNKFYKKNEIINMVNNLGMCDDFIYDDIMVGKENPSKNIDKYVNIRKNKLNIYIVDVINDYSIIVNNKTLINLDYNIKLLVEGVTIKSDLSFDYLTKKSELDIYFYNKPLEYGNYLLEFLCKTIINIYNSFKYNPEFSNKYLIYTLNKIFETEKLTSKLKEAKRVLIEAQQTETKEVFDVSNNEKPDKNDKFSYDDLDMDAPDLDAGFYNMDL